MADLHALDRLAGRRYGLATTSELLASGYSKRQIETMAANGTLIRVRVGVFRVAGSPLCIEQSYLAAILATTGDPLISHLAAAQFRGFEGFPEPDGIDVLRVGKVAPRGEGIIGHRTLHLPPSHRSIVRGVPVTSIERTLVDLCGVVPAWRLEKTADELARRKVLNDRRLHHTIEQVPVSGRRAIVPARVYAESRPYGFNRGGSDPELDVQKVLRKAGVFPLPQQQVRVRVDGHTYYIDHAWSPVLQGFEFMGFDPHGNLVSRFHDGAMRTFRLQRIGWNLWPITARTPEREVIEVAREIVATLPPN